MPVQLQAGFVKRITPLILLYCHAQYLAAVVVYYKKHDM